MMVVGLPHINQGKHHKNKGLQGNDQNVKERPGSASEHMPDKAQHSGSTTQQRNQHEQEFAREHVAEES